MRRYLLPLVIVSLAAHLLVVATDLRAMQIGQSSQVTTLMGKPVQQTGPANSNQSIFWNGVTWITKFFARTYEVNVLDYGASASLAQITAVNTDLTGNFTGSLNSDFKVGQHVVLYGAGPTPSVTTPAAPTVTAVTSTKDPSGPQNNTRWSSGCAVENSIAWCTAGSPTCRILAVSMYESGQSVTIAGAGSAGAALTATINSIDDANDNVTLSTNALTSVNGAAITGANCTTSRSVKVWAVDAQGGWSAPSTTATLAASPSALNWGTFLQDEVAYQANAIAYCFASCEGAACTPILSGCEVPTYTWNTSGFGVPWRDRLLGANGKAVPTYIDYDDINRPYAFDFNLAKTVQAGAVNQNLYATITALSGNTFTVTPAPTSTGSFTMGHDDAPAFNAAIAAACNASYQCGTVYIPMGTYPIAQLIKLLRGIGLKIMGASGHAGAELGAYGGTALVWRGALGGIVISVNQEQAATLQDFGIYTNQGTTPGVDVDIDTYDPGDGPGIVLRTTKWTLVNLMLGGASEAIRVSNIDASNTDMGTIRGTDADVISGASPWAIGGGIGLDINSLNALNTIVEQSTLGGKIGALLTEGGATFRNSPFANADTVPIWMNGGNSHPVIVEATRIERPARFVYSAVQGNGGGGAQVILRGNTFAGMRPFNDAAFVTGLGAGTILSQGNEYIYPFEGYNSQCGPIPSPGVQFRPGSGTSLEMDGDYVSVMLGNQMVGTGFTYAATWKGEQGLTSGCASQITPNHTNACSDCTSLVAGAATPTAACMSSAFPVMCDNHSANNPFKCVQGDGQLTITGTGTDVICWSFQ